MLKLLAAMAAAPARAAPKRARQADAEEAPLQLFAPARSPAASVAAPAPKLRATVVEEGGASADDQLVTFEARARARSRRPPSPRHSPLAVAWRAWVAVPGVPAAGHSQADGHPTRVHSCHRPRCEQLLACVWRRHALICGSVQARMWWAAPRLAAARRRRSRCPCCTSSPKTRSARSRWC